MSTKRLSGKIALVTGAAIGIGAEIAKRFQEEGASVFVADMNREEGEKTAASIGAVFVPLDVTSEDSWKAALASVLERAGGYTDKAYLRGAIFTRERVRELQQKSLEEMAQRLERELLSESSMQAGSSASQEEI